MNFDSYITSNTKIALTVKNYTEFVNKTDFNKKRFNLKKAAFTLAETLITLTIIGVIAALTVPNLISSYQKHTYVVGLKKAYSQLQNAVKMIPITQGCPPGDFDCAGWNDGYHYENGSWVYTPVTNIEGQEFNGNSENKRLYLLSKQFKINKLCYYGSTDKSCKNVSKIYSPTHINNYFITNDGTIYAQNSSWGIDINGFRGPNKFGRDQFKFELYNLRIAMSYNWPDNIAQDLVIPIGSKLYADIYNDPNYYWRNNNKCTTEMVNKEHDETRYCTGRVLEENAMNY